MSVHNGKEFLAQAIDSILFQTFQDFEFLIVDDASTDGCAKILESYRIRDPRIKLLTNPKNIGLTRSLNRAFEHVTGVYIARMDADDLSDSRRLAQQVTFLEKRKDIGLLGSHYDLIDGKGAVLHSIKVPTDDLAIRWKAVFHSPFCHSSVMFRRCLLSLLGSGYDPGIRYAQDFDLWTRMLPLTRAQSIPTSLVALRKHAGQVSIKKFTEQQNFANRIAKREIDSLLQLEHVDDASVVTLREAYIGFVSAVGVESKIWLKLFFKIYDKFYEKHKEKYSTVQCQSFSNHVISSVFNAIPARKLIGVESLATFYLLLNVSPKASMVAVWRRLKRRVAAPLGSATTS